LWRIIKQTNMKISKFIKDLFTTGFTQIISSLLVIILLKIMAVSLSKEYFGIFMVIRKIVGIVMPLITLNLGVGLARYVSYEKEKEKEFLNFSLLVIIFFSLVVMIFFYIFKNSLSQIYKKNKPVIIYAGGLTKIRGIKEIVQAMEYISDDAELWPLGEWENEKFKEECKKLKGWKHTKYLGFKKLEEVYRLMKMADIGVFLIYPEKRHKMGLLLKLLNIWHVHYQ